MSQCTPLNFPWSLLLKLAMLEDNSAYLNFLINLLFFPLPTLNTQQKLKLK